MTATYLGHLQKTDPLYHCFQKIVQPQLGLYGNLDYRVFRVSASNNVYLYEETRSLRTVIGKFYYSGHGPGRDAARMTMEHEFAALNHIRSIGFSGETCHYVARPFGKVPELNELLLEEKCGGESLSSIIKRAIYEKNDGLLFYKLTALAWFLSKWHNRTAMPEQVHFEKTVHYAEGILHTLAVKDWISEHRHGKWKELIRQYRDNPFMYADRQVIVHGDATPENFLFGDGAYVISYDLERMRYADRLFDVGRLCAELAHFFMLHAGDRFQAERFIGHFLWEYSCHFPDREAAFRAITGRLPFYMGINFMRIARNSYFDWNYRQQLLNAAADCLKGGLR